jgi:hypothetical protein
MNAFLEIDGSGEKRNTEDTENCWRTQGNHRSEKEDLVLVGTRTRFAG